MNNVIEEILLNEPKGENPIMILRRRFIGSIIDINRLPELGFNWLENSSENGWKVYVRYINKKRNRITIHVSNEGIISMVEYSRFLNLQCDGIGAPYGWYQMDELSVRSKNKILNELETIVKIFPPEQKNDLFIWAFERLNFYYKEHDCPSDELMGGFAHDFYYKNKYNEMSFITYLAYTQRLNTRDSILLLDLPFLCGKLKLEREFYHSIRRINELGLEMYANTYTNIGSVLCDDFGIYDMATNCFKAAIQLESHHKQARNNIWISSTKQIGHLIWKNKYNEAIIVGEEIISVVGVAENHIFYSYLGIAYELSGNVEKAKENYMLALFINSDSKISRDRLKSIEIPINDVMKTRRVIMYLFANNQHNGLKPEIQY